MPYTYKYECFDRDVPHVICEVVVDGRLVRFLANYFCEAKPVQREFGTRCKMRPYITGRFEAEWTSQQLLPAQKQEFRDDRYACLNGLSPICSYLLTEEIETGLALYTTIQAPLTRWREKEYSGVVNFLPPDYEKVPLHTLPFKLFSAEKKVRGLTLENGKVFGIANYHGHPGLLAIDDEGQEESDTALIVES